MTKNKIQPPTFFLIYLVLAIVLHILLPIVKIIFFPLNLFGVILIILGILINLWADNAFKKKKTTVKPFEKPLVLIIRGPFKFSRHPMYLGFVFVLFGAAFLLGSLSIFLMPIAMFITLQVKFIPFEEKNSEELFGQKYKDYKKSVRQWL